MAVLFWSTSASCLVQLKEIPVYMLTAMILSCNFTVTICRVVWQKKWSEISTEPLLWLAGIVGVAGNDLCYYLALRAIPPAFVELISWSWPIMVMIYIYRFRLSPVMQLSLLLGLLSVGLLCFGNLTQITHFSRSNYYGFLWALGSAMAWSFYIVVSRKFRDAPQEMVGLYAGCGAVIAWLLHSRFETQVHWAWHFHPCMIWLALGPATLAYYAWDYGVSYGAIQKAALYSYVIPFLSYIWLINIGAAHFSWAGVASFCLLTTAVFLQHFSTLAEEQCG